MNSSKGTITISEAQKIIAPAAFTTMVKPIGASCNLDCTYCYYLSKAELYPASPLRMSDDILEKYILQTIEGNEVPVITFCWHGGEPLLAGMDFYRRAFALQKKYSGNKKIINTIQTNGTLIDREWCDLFIENDLLVGISIDGPEYIHDIHRKDRKGAPTFSRVMRGIEQVLASNVEFNTLSTVNKTSEGHGAQVYTFLKSIGSKYMQFLPVVERVNGQITPWSVDAKAFGTFMTDIFDIWIRRDVGEYFVQLFDAALAGWYGVMPGLCVFTESCGDALAVEHNGDVYSCDHFVYPENKIGNIMQTDISAMYRSPEQQSFGVFKRTSLSWRCQKCIYRFACNGGCPKYRFGTNYLCEGYYHFFSHVDPYMNRMASLLKEERSPACIMAEL